MLVDRRKAAVFGAALVLRLLLWVLFPSLPDLLTGRVEVSTPVNSFKRREYRHAGGTSWNCVANAMRLVQEGLFMYTRNVSPYDGGVFHQVSPAIDCISLGKLLTVRPNI